MIFLTEKNKFRIDQSTNNYIYMQDIFNEAAFQFSETDEDCETLHT